MLGGVNEEHCNLNTRLEENMLKMMFKIVNKTSPVYLQERVKLTSEIHLKTTRSALSKKIFIKKKSTMSDTKLFTTRAASVWNSLPYKLTSMESFLQFKKGVEVFYKK